jgi:hypothetical protein
MLFQSLRALCLASGGPGSIWNHLGAPVRSTGVCGRFACRFWTDLHCADVKPLDCEFVVLSRQLCFDALYIDILEEWEGGQQGYLQDLKALI